MVITFAVEPEISGSSPKVDMTVFRNFCGGNLGKKSLLLCNSDSEEEEPLSERQKKAPLAKPPGKTPEARPAPKSSAQLAKPPGKTPEASSLPKVGYAAPNRALKEVATIVYTAPNRASDERSQKENQATLYAAPNRAPHGVSQKEKNKSLITKENRKKIAYSYILKDLVWVYTWHITIRRHQKLMHIIYGNTTRLITKLCTDGLPKLASEISDAEGFLSWQLNMEGWCAVKGATPYVLGPAPVRPAADQPEARARYDTKMSEGLQYLCAAIENHDIRCEVASNASGLGPNGFVHLQARVLQGMAPGPALQQVLDGLRFSIDGNIVAFQSRFTKFATAMQPPLAANVLCQKYVIAITGDTSGTFDDCVTSVLATDDQSNFQRFANSLTKLVSLKSVRMTSQKPTAVGQSAQAHNSTVGSESAELKKLQEQVKKLEVQLREAKNGKQVEKPNEGSLCDYTFPNGETCGGNHPRENCWYEDPTRCRNPEIRRRLERKIQSKSSPSDREGGEIEEGHYYGNSTEIDDFFYTEVVENPPHDTYIVAKEEPGDKSSESVENNIPVKTTGGGGTFIIDTGAPDHIICDERCILHPEEHTPVDIMIKTGTGSNKATSRGPATFIVYNKDGHEYSLTRNVIFCPEFNVNLFSPQRDFKDHGTRISFNDACCMTFVDNTVVPFSQEDQIFKMSYTYPSKSSGVLKTSNDSGTQVKICPLTVFFPSWEHCVPCGINLLPQNANHAEPGDERDHLCEVSIAPN